LSKVLGWLVTTSILFTAGYGFLLPGSYQLLVDWLGPMLGLGIRTALTCFYMTFGDPFVLGSFLLPAWIFASFVGGFISRRSLGGIVVTVSSYSLLLTLASLSIFKIISSMGGMLQSAGIVIPPIPAGFSTYELFNAPLIGPLIQQFFSSLSLIGGGGMPDISTAILGIAYPLLVNAVKILVPACIAGLVGGFIGGRIWRGFSRRERKFKEESLVAALIILLLSIVALQSSPLQVASAAEESMISPMVIEGLGGSVQADGSVIVASGFTSPAAEVMKEIPTDALEGNLLIFLGTQYFQPSCLPSEIENIPMSGGEQISGLYPAAPSTFLVTLYDSGVANENSADIVASTLSDRLGVQFSSGITVEQKLDHEMNISISFFLAGESYMVVEEAIMDLLKETEGLSSYIHDVYSNGAFTPSKVSWSANGTFVALGLVKGSEMLKLFKEPSEQLNFPAEDLASQLFEPGKLTPFLLQVSYWKQAYHSSPQEHTFDLAEFLKNSEPITASSSADVSLLFLNTPSLGGLDQGWNLFGEGMAVKPLSAGETTSRIASTFNFTFPARLFVSKSVDMNRVSEGDDVCVTVEIWNNDTDPLYNVVLDDASTGKIYASGANLSAGSYSKSWNVLTGGERVIHRYNLTLNNIGVYTLPSAQVEYQSHGTTYLSSSGTATVRVDHPPVSEVFTRGVTFVWGLIAMFVDAIVPPYGEVAASFIIFIIIVGIVVSIALSFRRPKVKVMKG
jgi:hypothetical protein